MSDLLFYAAAALFVAGILASILGSLGNKGVGPSYLAHDERWGCATVLLIVLAIICLLVSGFLARHA